MIQRIVSPIDGSVVAERELADDARVEAILSAATAAQSGWRATSLDERIRLCEAMVQWLIDHV